jgi:starvation-inducible DNA-binding protein
LSDIRQCADQATIHTVHGDVDAADPSSADLLHVIVDDMERAAWMLKSENRKI